MKSILDNENLYQRFQHILGEMDSRQRMYVYRLDQAKKPLKPALLISEPFPDLLECLRDEHGGGEFRILIRQSDVMLLSGDIAIEPPIKLANRGDASLADMMVKLSTLARPTLGR